MADKLARVHLPHDAGSGSPVVCTEYLDIDQHWSEAWSCLDGNEQQRANRLMHVASRQTFVFAHALLRMMLSLRLDVPPLQFEFGAGRFGKPFVIRGDSGICFNVSYRNGVVALAFAEAAVGVDVECCRDDVDVWGVANRFFTEPEQALLQTQQPGHREALFFELWTRKEALIKAAGLGLDSMTSLNSNKPTIGMLDEGGEAGRFHLFSLPVRQGYALACAVKTAGR